MKIILIVVLLIAFFGLIIGYYIFKEPEKYYLSKDEKIPWPVISDYLQSTTWVEYLSPDSNVVTTYNFFRIDTTIFGTDCSIGKVKMNFDGEVKYFYWAQYKKESDINIDTSNYYYITLATILDTVPRNLFVTEITLKLHYNFEFKKDGAAVHFMRLESMHRYPDNGYLAYEVPKHVVDSIDAYNKNHYAPSEIGPYSKRRKPEYRKVEIESNY